ncbi:MAG: S9 family peptidase [Prevotellaceae bacterium]|nr:S9 family peptidase [Prevotellaceae bacterium]
MAVAISLISCGDTATSSSDSAAVIGKQEINISNRRITPEALWAFGRLNDMQVSPDGTKILYGVTYFCVPENKSNRDLFVINSDGTDNRQITATPIGEHAAKWVKGGEKIAFLSAESGEMQLWEMNVDGSNRVQISTREGGISDFLYSPDNSQVLFIADVKYGERTVDVYPDLDKASGIIVDDLMYKHWDEWVTAIPHPFLADSNGSELSNERDLLEDEPFECPMKPFGGIEQVTFSPDGKTIAYVCRRKVGLEYALSTNSDIYLYDIATGTTVKNLTDGMMGYDINPSFSPDGTLLAFQSMERDGCESDKNRLFVLNLVTGERTDLSAGWDQSTESFIWSKDGKQIYLISCQHAVTQIYRADVAAKTFSKITDGQHDYESVALTDKGLAGVRHSMSMPNEIYTIDEQSGLQTPLTFENKHILDQLEMGRVEERWIPTTDGKQMLVWVVYPPEFDPKKKYPTLLYCQGGPQSPVSQFWSYRWNLQIMAANDYIIVAPNRRGLYGFGQEWLEQISKDYGGQNMRDYLSAIDAVAKEPYVDSDHLGCVGASYGGFSVYWLAGHHNKRFKAFIAHDGMFNLEQQFLETEEMWFVNWDIGGAYWDKNNIAAQRTYASSPHRFVDKWDAPILVIHGEKDYRILASQGMAAFNAAKLRGVPAEMLIFPDENHWVLKPQNGILWQRTFFRWLDRWLKVNE